MFRLPDGPRLVVREGPATSPLLRQSKFVHWASPEPPTLENTIVVAAAAAAAAVLPHLPLGLRAWGSPELEAAATLSPPLPSPALLCHNLLLRMTGPSDNPMPKPITPSRARNRCLELPWRVEAIRPP
ncbi:hypothetical protein BS78_05G045900 [Paspalum vaginatum]|nr:hypothetical protein BS78_05G045900 [Paspalum vaginatum]